MLINFKYTLYNCIIFQSFKGERRSLSILRKTLNPNATREGFELLPSSNHLWKFCDSIVYPNDSYFFLVTDFVVF